MKSIHEWKPELYDDKLAFISQYGKGILEILNVQQGERILDLGCGTGDLSFEIAQLGASVTGMDLSEEMMGRARTKYPGINFISGNAESFSLDEPVNAVFSNAALHWIKNAENVISCVWNALEEGGRFVAEFGGKGNIEMIVKSITDVFFKGFTESDKKHIFEKIADTARRSLFDGEYWIADYKRIRVVAIK